MKVAHRFDHNFTVLSVDLYNTHNILRLASKCFRRQYNIMCNNCSESSSDDRYNNLKLNREGVFKKKKQKTSLLLYDTRVLSEQTGSRVVLFAIYGRKNNG